jgi:hypothetical protein
MCVSSVKLSFGRLGEDASVLLISLLGIKDSPLLLLCSSSHMQSVGYVIRSISRAS